MSKVHELTGQQFGELKVLYRNGSKNGRALWRCLCSCGKEIDITGNKLLTGHNKSCGCVSNKLRKENLEDLTGQKFSFLTVISRDEMDHKNGRRYWICQCDCGNKTVVCTNHLKSGAIKSCGCIKSKGEMIVSQLLREMDIPFERQKSFRELVGDKGTALKFDFYLNDMNILIEYQGEQHYQKTRNWEDRNNFSQRQRYDQLKRDYCTNNGITLIEIPYTDFKQINRDYLEKRLKNASRKGNLV